MEEQFFFLHFDILRTPPEKFSVAPVIVDDLVTRGNISGGFQFDIKPLLSEAKKFSWTTLGENGKILI